MAIDAHIFGFDIDEGTWVKILLDDEGELIITTA